MILLSALLFACICEATETKVTVRVLAKDAKYVGTSMGGALVILRDSLSGEILARGITKGETGNTKTIMAEPRKRHAAIYDDTSAKFVASVNIKEPTLVDVEVTGPLAQKQTAVKSTTQVWLIPGKDITGNGITLELPGFSIRLLQPQPHETIALNGKTPVSIKANVVMMCGCPTEPGGVWDSSKYEIKAIVKHNGETTSAMPLSFAGKTSTYSGNLEVSKPGAYEIILYAYDPETGNTGVDSTTFNVK